MNQPPFTSDNPDTLLESGCLPMSRTERLILTGFMLFILGMLVIAAWNAILLASAGRASGGPLKSIVEAVVALLR